MTFTGARNLYGALTDNQDSAALTVGDTLINEGIRMMLGNISWPFLQDTVTTVTVADQQFYNLPNDVEKIIDMTITIGTIQYHPKQVTSFSDWNFINTTTGVTNDNPSFFFILDGTVGFWPIPDSSSNTITYQYQKQVRDISKVDVTAGSVVSIANAGTAVIGTGTAWTSQMIGSYIRFTNTNALATGAGDGLWYPISAVGSTTTLTLGRPYLGTSISASTTAYTIGDIMVIPERYQKGPVFWAAAQYWLKESDLGISDRFQDNYEGLMDQMREDEGKKTTDPVVDDGYFNPRQINPNFNNTVTG